MLIISKFKDFYDHLSGIYGEDPLIVLNRLDFTMPKFSNNSIYTYPDEPEKGIFSLYIGGYIIEAYYDGNKIYYGEDLKQFEFIPKHSSRYNRYHMNTPEKEKEYVSIKIEGHRYIEHVNLIIKKDTTKLNDKYNCPILLRKNYDKDEYLYKNCILKDLNLNSFVSPEDVYKMISDWISYQRTIAENHDDNRTNIQKIESKGFDKKTSFRPNMK